MGLNSTSLSGLSTENNSRTGDAPGHRDDRTTWSPEQLQKYKQFLGQAFDLPADNASREQVFFALSHLDEQRLLRAAHEITRDQQILFTYREATQRIKANSNKKQQALFLQLQRDALIEEIVSHLYHLGIVQ